MTLAAIFAALAVLFREVLPAAAAAFLVLTALLSRGLTARISSAWLGFGAVLGAFNNRIVLGLIFFLVLTPVALLARLFGHDPLGLRSKAGPRFLVRERRYVPEDLENPW